MEVLDLVVDVVSLASPGIENVIGVLGELRFPGLNLVGVNVKLLSEFSQGVVALQGGQGDFGFEGGAVVSAFASHRSGCRWRWIRSQDFT